MKPLAIDLFCGLGGWTAGLLSEGWNVVGFDIKRHEYDDERYPAQLVLQDVLTINGSQFKNADLIVASPPCQKYSWLAMPWSRSKSDNSKAAKELRRQWEAKGPDNRLFDACFRIQREAIDAAGRYIPLVIENVRGAQEWVGKAKANYGSFYLWGDVEMIGKRIVRAGARFGASCQYAPSKGSKVPGQDWNNFKNHGTVSPHWRMEGIKTVRHINRRDGHTRHLTNQYEHDAVKISADHEVRGVGMGIKVPSKSHERSDLDSFGWSKETPLRSTGSHTKARAAAASAKIAKIPLPLSQYIASVYKP